MRPTTFIVGTGRSGSSALSRILNGHPKILSLNEMLAALTPVALPEGEVSGTEFWGILSGPNGIFDLMIRSDAALPEFLYPKNPGRHSAENGIPALVLMTLPPLTEDPDGELDVNVAFCDRMVGLVGQVPPGGRERALRSQKPVETR